MNKWSAGAAFVPLLLVAALLCTSVSNALPDSPAPGGAADERPFEQYLNIRSASGGSLSPDGSQVAFLTNITGVNQAWTVAAAGGWPEQLTFYSDTVRFVRWSPEPGPPGAPGQLVFGMDAGGNERTQLYLAAGDGSRLEPLTTNPKAIHRFGGWSRDGRRIAYSSNERHEAFFDIYVMDIKTRRAERVLTNDSDNAVAAWSPEGDALVIRRSNAGFDADLYRLDLRTKDLLHLTPHQGAVRYDDVSWPPGPIVYATSDDGRDHLNIVAIDPTAPRPTFVEEAPHDIEALVFSRDGRRVLVAANDGGYTSISLRDGGLKGRELPVRDVPRGVLSGFDFSRDGRLLLFRAEGASAPGDLWIHDTSLGTTRRVTQSSLAGIPKDSFVEAVAGSYESFDGLQIPVFLYVPGGSGRGSVTTPGPAIIMVHGGPEGQHRPSFSQVNQFFLSRGYAILAPNIRGSTGYGKRFHRLDDVRLRGDAI